MRQYQVGIKYSGIDQRIVTATSASQAAWIGVRDFNEFSCFEPDSIVCVYHKVNEEGDVWGDEFKLSFFLDAIEAAKAAAVLNLFKEKIGEQG